jgi:hypothetical protein
LLGLIFFVFGLNGFLEFIPPPTEPPPAGAAALGQALFASGYLLQLIKGTEVLAGALLLANFLVPFALLLLAPVIVNIFLFHVVLAPSGWALASCLVVIESLLAFHHRRTYAPLFRRTEARDLDALERAHYVNPYAAARAAHSTPDTAEGIS